MSHYCEENIYRLAQKLINTNTDDAIYIIFISSISKKTPIWMQNLCEDNNNPVVWDYHVILCLTQHGVDSAKIFDFDSQLVFPVSAVEYATASFRPEKVLPARYEQVV